MPEPAPRRPRRRINPDKAPWDRLPLIKADSPIGPITVIRGDFDPDELTDTQRDQVHDMHDREFVVFTNGLGQHTLAWRGQSIDRDIDPARMGSLPRGEDLGDWSIPAPHSIESGAMWLRYNANRLLDLADTWEALAADGWEVHDDPRLSPYGEVRQRTKRTGSGQAGPASGSTEPS
ncbi:hypothetical protein ASC64_17630 [Nocardioides sp. Root122]|uniref:hypothetical protein n=1 Tax=Nocardioides TaxID=1839 RepID=UPI0007029765|nr:MULTISPECIES: hypothetical protein [Nocardioides]KQV63407.1 hypothetical protein ASC64_17630 [Nocardioides sp. Root122]MCK9826071.1 hypothetical protein [Nocardioides cavernae]